MCCADESNARIKRIVWRFAALPFLLGTELVAITAIMIEITTRFGGNSRAGAIVYATELADLAYGVGFHGLFGLLVFVLTDRAHLGSRAWANRASRFARIIASTGTARILCFALAAGVLRIAAGVVVAVVGGYLCSWIPLVWNCLPEAPPRNDQGFPVVQKDDN